MLNAALRQKSSVGRSVYLLKHPAEIGVAVPAQLGHVVQCDILRVELFDIRAGGADLAVVGGALLHLDAGNRLQKNCCLLLELEDRPCLKCSLDHAD